MNLSIPIPFSRPHGAHPVEIHPPSPFSERGDESGIAAANTALMHVLDQLDYGVMLVGPRGQVRFANRVALRSCGSTRALRLVGGQLQARREVDQQRIERALAATRGGHRSLLAVSSQDGPCTLAIVPLDDPYETPVSESVSLVMFGRDQVCEPLTVDLFAREHALTAAESTVLRHLAFGRRPCEIAREVGVAVSTVRTQVMSIRRKTGARNINELMRLVTTLPPIVPALGI